MENEVDGNTSEPDETHWDKYREHHEPVEHWELRKEFLKKNYGRFPENRLLCLSKTFANMEFLGCKYPMETMELVQELSLGIVEDYRSKKSTRLQRTFMKASDAAENKAKRRQTTVGVDFNQNNRVSSIAAMERKPGKVIRDGMQFLWPIQTKFTLKGESHGRTRQNTNKSDGASQISKNNVALQSLLRLEALDLNEENAKVSSEDLKTTCCDDIEDISTLNELLSDIGSDGLCQSQENGVEVRDAKKLKLVLKDLYLMRQINEENEATMLCQSFQSCQLFKVIDFIAPKVPGLADALSHRIDFIIGDPKNPCFIAHGEGAQKKDARRDAAGKALKYLQQYRPFITIKDADRRIIERIDIVPADKRLGPKLISPRDMMASDSKAVKIMLKSGWKGQGIGKNEDGRLFPIDTTFASAYRAGLGMKTDALREFEIHVMELLRTELESLYDYDIEFAPEFNTEERKIIHTCRTIQLKNKSYRQGNKRRLVVSRKMEPSRLFSEVMKLGGENFKYKIDQPTKASPTSLPESIIMEEDPIEP